MKALVLSSGGVDSTTCVGLAVLEFEAENVSTVSVFYGQRHDKEIECARAVADHYGLMHYEIDLSPVMAYSDCSLLAHSTAKISHKSYAEQIAEDGMVKTYVPFRNGLMISAVAALALSINPDDKTVIYLGAHADDAAGNAYADCSPEFLEAINKAVNIGTYGKVSVTAPFINSNKAGVVKAGLDICVPYELTWSCYEGGDEPCGKCGTCLDRAAAFAKNGVEDPAIKKVRKPR